jgi:murein DD-endopeptidase MepM/ murein hydrolase activator NlpD
VSLLQRELDFSEYVSTEDDLLKTWATTDRVVRSHRRRPRFTKIQICAAFIAILGALSLSGRPSVGQANQADVLAAPAPLSVTELPAVEATDRLVELRSRGGLRATRTLMRIAPKTGTVRGAVVRWAKPLATLRVTSCFGPRWGTQHQGVDLKASVGATIRAVGAGRVVQAGWNFSGYGYSVVIDHGSWLTLYAHASRVTASVGQKVAAGAKIALVGSTGHSTGPHLHLGVAKASTLGDLWGNFVDPARWLDARGVSVPRCT